MNDRSPMPLNPQGGEKFTSLYLVNEINKFRELENEKSDKKKLAMLQHKSFLSKIEEEFQEEINGQNILPVTYKDKKGEERKMYELNYDDSIQMLSSESRTVRKAVKQVLKGQRKRIEELETEKRLWQIKRGETKVYRLHATNTIKKFVEYAKNQGSNSPEMYYTNFTKVTNKALELLELLDPEIKINRRDSLKMGGLVTLEILEIRTKEILEHCMQENLYYKDIYKEVSSGIKQLAESLRFNPKQLN
ncbi:MAG: hypothetical protein ACOCWG_05725 [bacterium]